MVLVAGSALVPRLLALKAGEFATVTTLKFVTLASLLNVFLAREIWTPNQFIAQVDFA